MWVCWENWAEKLVLKASRDPRMGVLGIEVGIRQAEDQGSLASISAVLCGSLLRFCFGVGERVAQSLSNEGIGPFSLG